MRKDPSIIRRPIFEIDGDILFGWDERKLAQLLQ